MNKYIEQKRQQLEMSITDLCRQAKTQRLTYYKFKDGGDITLKTLKKYCKVLNLTIKIY